MTIPTARAIQLYVTLTELCAALPQSRQACACLGAPVQHKAPRRQAFAPQTVCIGAKDCENKQYLPSCMVAMLIEVNQASDVAQVVGE
jgi:hypothetical protein